MIAIFVTAICLLAITCLVLNSKIEKCKKKINELKAQARLDKAFKDAEEGVIYVDEYDY